MDCAGICVRLDGRAAGRLSASRRAGPTQHMRLNLNAFTLLQQLFTSFGSCVASRSYLAIAWLLLLVFQQLLQARVFICGVVAMVPRSPGVQCSLVDASHGSLGIPVAVLCQALRRVAQARRGTWLLIRSWAGSSGTGRAAWHTLHVLWTDVI